MTNTKNFPYSITENHNNTCDFSLYFDSDDKYYNLLDKLLTLIKIEIDGIFIDSNKTSMYNEIVIFSPSTALPTRLGYSINITKYNFSYKSVNVLLSFLFPYTMSNLSVISIDENEKIDYIKSIKITDNSKKMIGKSININANPALKFKSKNYFEINLIITENFSNCISKYDKY